MLTAAIARHLAELDPDLFGTFDEPGASIHLEQLPDEPVDAVGIFARPGPLDDNLDGYDYEAVQILVRRDASGGRARSGYTVAKAIRDRLNGLRHVTLAPGTADEVRLVKCLTDDSGPYNLGDDANGRPRWAIRFTTQTAHDTEHSIV